MSENPRLSTRFAVGKPKEREGRKRERKREADKEGLEESERALVAPACCTGGRRKRRKEKRKRRGTGKEEWGEGEGERESRGKNRGAAVRTRTTLPGPASRRGVLLRSRCLKRNL